ncbi:MAG: hypothetical protein OXC53_04730 [Rhodobacteraceae bacterium]|nr:hypothetical protein [Paracoccaceae bacterium]
MKTTLATDAEHSGRLIMGHSLALHFDPALLSRFCPRVDVSGPRLDRLRSLFVSGKPLTESSV